MIRYNIINCVPYKGSNIFLKHKRISILFRRYLTFFNWFCFIERTGKNNIHSIGRPAGGARLPENDSTAFSPILHSLI
jgi:hypothetical protein